ncbi:hypothetical protein [Salibacterium halotolerans]|uniref:hypothetical protein n=1 Tax=Salibacterium halotolerans TaxID=1884432 RepID=UPI000B8090BB|nr:hypothetical protein [Salibacterium halotolerans]
MNIPTLFGMTPNAVFNQLYAALITYVLLRWLYQRTSKGEVMEALSFISFTRHFPAQNLPIDWLSEMAASLKGEGSLTG